MAGNSDRENKAQGLYSDIGNFNPTATNYFSNYQAPFSPQQQIGALNSATTQSGNLLKRQGARSVASARKSAASRAKAAGYGGTIGQDLATGAGEAASANTTDALQQLQASATGQLPGIMNSANTQNLAVTQGRQSADFQNISDMYKKFSSQGGLLDAFSNDTTLDDILSGMTSMGNLASGGANIYKAFK